MIAIVASTKERGEREIRDRHLDPKRCVIVTPHDNNAVKGCMLDYALWMPDWADELSDEETGIKFRHIQTILAPALAH